MQVKAYSKSGKEVGQVTVIDKSRKGQRCVQYVDYRPTGGRK